MSIYQALSNSQATLSIATVNTDNRHQAFRKTRPMNTAGRIGGVRLRRIRCDSVIAGESGYVFEPTPKGQLRTVFGGRVRRCENHDLEVSRTLKMYILWASQLVLPHPTGDELRCCKSVPAVGNYAGSNGRWLVSKRASSGSSQTLRIMKVVYGVKKPAIPIIISNSPKLPSINNRSYRPDDVFL